MLNLVNFGVATTCMNYNGDALILISVLVLAYQLSEY